MLFTKNRYICLSNRAILTTFTRKTDVPLKFCLWIYKVFDYIFRLIVTNLHRRCEIRCRKYAIQKSSEYMPSANLRSHRQEPMPSSRLAFEFQYMRQCFAATKIKMVSMFTPFNGLHYDPIYTMILLTANAFGAPPRLMTLCVGRGYVGSTCIAKVTMSII
jgi:hypothetical protein